MNERISWKNLFMDIASTISKKSTCCKMQIALSLTGNSSTS